MCEGVRQRWFTAAFTSRSAADSGTRGAGMGRSDAGSPVRAWMEIKLRRRNHNRFGIFPEQCNKAVDDLWLPFTTVLFRQAPQGSGDDAFDVACKGGVRFSGSTARVWTVTCAGFSRPRLAFDTRGDQTLV